MRTATGAVEMDTLSEAWLRTLVQVSQAPDRKQFHTVTRVANPTAEDDQIRAAADEMLAALGHQPIETVANTIFPHQLAMTSSDTADLVLRYRTMYPTIRRVHKDNRHGTYFGRMVEYPAPSQPLDQLTNLIRKINQERAGGRPKGARYEIPIDTGLHGQQDDPDPAGSRAASAADHTTAATPIHSPGRDTSPMAFPCLSLCSFQLDNDRLHLSAHYRSQYLVQRGYGNYLGLARLQAYVAGVTGIEVGQLLIVAGLAHADSAKYRVAATVKRSGKADTGD